MNESKIRVWVFSVGATAVWLLLAYAVVFVGLSVRETLGLVGIAFLLMLVAMGQGEK